MTTPYSPILLDPPVVNPSIAGWSRPFPYLSPSQFNAQVTALDTANLLNDGDAAQQTQALYDLIRQAGSHIDTFCFGSSPSVKGGSLCATNDVEQWRFKVIQNELRLACKYRPLIQLTSCDIGFSLLNMQSIGPQVAALVFPKVVTWVVPIGGYLWQPNGPQPYLNGPIRNGLWLWVVWSYDNGYPHTALAAPVEAGSSTLHLEPTSQAGGLIGVVPGQTALDVLDYTGDAESAPETVIVESVSGSTITTTAPLLYNHTPPDAPDFIPVSGMPWAVQRAAVECVASLIKYQGDGSIILQGIAEAANGEDNPGERTVDIVRAFKALKRYAMPSLIKN